MCVCVRGGGGGGGEEGSGYKGSGLARFSINTVEGKGAWYHSCCQLQNILLPAIMQ